MKKLNRLVLFIEIVLIVIMSGIAAYSLFAGGTSMLLLAAGLICVGLLTIVWKNWHPEIFGCAVLISVVPCLLQHNTVDLLNALNENLPGIPTTLVEALGLGLVLVLGYLVLKLLNGIQIEHKRLVAGQAEKEEIRRVTQDKMLAAAIFVFFSGLISVPLILVANWLTADLTAALSSFTGNVIAIGLGIMLLMAGCLYWLGRTLKS
jgi:ABC-type multidrug transport system fused ATPase/permease subunit